MDPLAHTLVGATLAETGLKKTTRYAVFTLIVGANLPDIDGIVNVLGHDASFEHRRGWTHGILAMVFLPLIFTGLIWLWDRYRTKLRKRKHSGNLQQNQHEASSRTHWLWLIGLSYLAIWSHPLLDWLNTYGVRLLMPFDERWFYGDTLFIIDPWLWLMSAAAVVMATKYFRKAIYFWLGLGGVITAIILSNAMVATQVKVIWCIALSSFVFMQWRVFKSQQIVARIGLAGIVVYICVLFSVARMAEQRLAETTPPVSFADKTTESAAAQAVRPLHVQANPVPGRPFTHRYVLEFDDHYQVFTPSDNAQLFAPAALEHAVVRKQQPNEIVLKAMQDESIRGFIHWMRFPYWTLEEHEDSWQVNFFDLRYQGPGLQHIGIGTASATVLKSEIGVD